VNELAFFVMVGCVAIASALYMGLTEIANAIRYRKVDVNITGPINFVLKRE
jgi:hypothetical protein